MRIIITTINYLASLDLDNLNMQSHFSSENKRICVLEEDKDLIPRIGEKVNVFYGPFPTVKSVVHDYENKIIWVLVE